MLGHDRRFGQGRDRDQRIRIDTLPRNEACFAICEIRTADQQTGIAGLVGTQPVRRTQGQRARLLAGGMQLDAIQRAQNHRFCEPEVDMDLVGREVRGRHIDHDRAAELAIAVLESARESHSPALAPFRVHAAVVDPHARLVVTRETRQVQGRRQDRAEAGPCRWLARGIDDEYMGISTAEHLFRVDIVMTDVMAALYLFLQQQQQVVRITNYLADLVGDLRHLATQRVEDATAEAIFADVDLMQRDQPDNGQDQQQTGAPATENLPGGRCLPS